MRLALRFSAKQNAERELTSSVNVNNETAAIQPPSFASIDWSSKGGAVRKEVRDPGAG